MALGRLLVAWATQSPEVPGSNMATYDIYCISTYSDTDCSNACDKNGHINPFMPEFTIVIFIHYKPRIAVAILDL